MRQLRIAIIDSNKDDRDQYKDYCNQSIGLDCALAVRSSDQFLLYQKADQALDIILFEIEKYVAADLDFSKKISKLKSVFPNVEIVVFTRIKEETIVIKAFNSGANGFLLKDLDKKKFEDYLLNTKQKGAAISPQIARLLIQRLNYEKVNTNDCWKTLSRKQLMIIDYLTEGLSVSDIADQLNISVNGVQYHIRSIYSKLNVRNKTALLKKYMTKKLS